MGFEPLGYHLVNVLLHLVNSVLVWRLLLRLAVPAAWTVAALFAVHPLHVESVAWIIERKDLLSALFYLTAVFAWMRFVEAPGRRRYVLALALFTAGLLSKSVVVTLPAALIIWHCWKRGGVTRADFRRLAPFFAVGLCITMADFVLYASRVPLSLGYSMVERLLIAARAWWFYAGKLLWPVDLAVIYPLWEIRAGDPVAWAYVLAAAASWISDGSTSTASPTLAESTTRATMSQGHRARTLTAGLSGSDMRSQERRASVAPRSVSMSRRPSVGASTCPSRRSLSWTALNLATCAWLERRNSNSSPCWGNVSATLSTLPPPIACNAAASLPRVTLCSLVAAASAISTRSNSSAISRQAARSASSRESASPDSLRASRASFNSLSRERARSANLST